MAKTPPPGMKICTSCEGDAFVEYEEDGRPVRDCCYHCGNTGFVTDEVAYHDRMRRLAESLAGEAVDRLRRDRNENAHAYGGEGWAFLAAENMISEYEYTQGVVWDYTDRMLKVLENMQQKEPTLLDVLLDRLAPLPEPVQQQEPDLSEQPVPTYEEYFEAPDAPAPAVIPQTTPFDKGKSPEATDDSIPF